MGRAGSLCEVNDPGLGNSFFENTLTNLSVLWRRPVAGTAMGAVWELGWSDSVLPDHGAWNPSILRCLRIRGRMGGHGGASFLHSNITCSLHTKNPASQRTPVPILTPAADYVWVLS